MQTKCYYVYRITNTLENKHYYGSRGTTINPSEDLGISYFSSSYNKSFIKKQKTNPEIFRYKVIQTFTHIADAIKLEIRLHEKFNVGKNPNFYNKVKQTSVGFDQSGTTQSEYTKNKKRKPIINLDTKEQYKGIKEASRVTGIQSRVLINVCKRKPNQTKAGGYHWAYIVKEADETYYDSLLQEILNEEKQRSINIGKKRKGKNNPSAKLTDIYCYLTNRLVAENVVIAEWAKNNNVCGPHLSSTITKKRKHSSGYYAKRKN